MNNELIDRHLDTILRASGSALRNYSMPKTIEAMRAALMAAINDSALTQQQGAEPDGYVYEFVSQFSGAPVWRHDSGEWNGQRPKSSRPYFFRPPKPAAQPVGLDKTSQFLARYLNEINKADEGDRDHDLEHHLEIALSAVSAAQTQVPDGWVPVPIELVQFLNGTGELEGMDFGSYPSPSEGDFTKKYWWRKYLPKVPDGTISAAKEEGK